MSARPRRKLDRVEIVFTVVIIAWIAVLNVLAVGTLVGDASPVSSARQGVTVR